MFEKVQPFLSTYIRHDRLFLQSILKDFSGKVLDVGCGDGRAQKYLPHDSEYIGLDFNPKATIQLDISKERYPFDDKTFDYVICNAVLEHVKNETFVLQEIHRVLKLGGVLYVSIPFMQPYHADPEDYRRFTEVGLETKLQDAGFHVIKKDEAYGTLVTIEYLLLTEAGRFLKKKSYWLNPLRWFYGMILFFVYVLCRIGNIFFFSLQHQDTYISPGVKMLCRRGEV